MTTTRVKIVKKPWGREVWYAVTPKYVGKILEIRKGHRLSLQYHRKKHESLFVLKGSFRLTLGRKSRRVGAGAAFTVRPRTRHRFEARYGPVTLLEVSTPQVHDIVRLEDDYGRK